MKQEKRTIDMLAKVNWYEN